MQGLSRGNMHEALVHKTTSVKSVSGHSFLGINPFKFRLINGACDKIKPSY